MIGTTPKHRLAAALAIIAALASAAPVAAQTPPLATEAAVPPAALAPLALGAEPIVLTDEIITLFVAALPRFVIVSDAIAARYGIVAGDDLETAYAALEANPQALAEMDALIIPLGFDGTLAFFRTFVAVMPAFMFAAGLVPPAEAEATRAAMPLPPTDENIALVASRLGDIMGALFAAELM